MNLITALGAGRQKYSAFRLPVRVAKDCATLIVIRLIVKRDSSAFAVLSLSQSGFPWIFAGYSSLAGAIC